MRVSTHKGWKVQNQVGGDAHTVLVPEGGESRVRRNGGAGAGLGGSMAKSQSKDEQDRGRGRPHDSM